MAIASLPRTVKARLLLALAEKGWSQQKHQTRKLSLVTMKFRMFQNDLTRLPRQTMRPGYTVGCRGLACNSREVLLRAAQALHRLLGR
jgi:hypothetical protein